MSITEQLTASKKASRMLAQIDDTILRSVILDAADRIDAEASNIVEANTSDLTALGQDHPLFDRLLLTKERIAGMAEGMRAVAHLPSPIGKVLEERIRPNGLLLSKVSVPLGVVGVIYEARPNVTTDIFALCLKSGNACVLKGGSDAQRTNEALVAILHDVLQKQSISSDVLSLLPSDRDSVEQLLNARGLVDVVIPRGGAELIRYVRDHARVPVIETGAGVVHIYFDSSGDVQKGKAIITNAKTRRPSVCNALDTLIIHQERLSDLAFLLEGVSEKQVHVHADGDAYAALDGSYDQTLLHHAKEGDFGREFLSLQLAIKTVASLDEALLHIAQYGSGHSEAIIAEDPETLERFLREVDAAAVYANASTAFTDGGEFGMGAEIGISTQKLHARGPMGLAELTSYKWMVRGDGQVRL